jgi:pantothenate synthetase
LAGSPAAHRLYARAIEATTKALSDQTPAPLDGVVKAVVRALSSRSPDARYVVGRDASQLVMLNRLPQGLRDRLLMGNLGLKREAFDRG